MTAPRAAAIAERLAEVRERIAAACARVGRSTEQVTLVVVTKGVAPWAIQQAAAAGIRDFGENRVQEAQSKRHDLSRLADHVRWHLVGHLQTNKVKTALGLFDIIHSVDSLHLAEAISHRATKPVPIFLEVNIAHENTKFGLSPDDLETNSAAIALLPNLEVRGLMTIAPQSATTEKVRRYFQRLREAGERLGLSELSMGMSDDFEVAIEEGATHVRIGRAVFEERYE